MSLDADMIHVEVVYALPHEQRVITETVDKSQTVEDIIKQSGVLDMYPEIDLAENKVGVFGRNVRLDSTVLDKDRIEIYRALLADPKEIRRKRAEQAKISGKADPVTGGKPNELRKK